MAATHYKVYASSLVTRKEVLIVSRYPSVQARGFIVETYTLDNGWHMEDRAGVASHTEYTEAIEDALDDYHSRRFDHKPYTIACYANNEVCSTEHMQKGEHARNYGLSMLGAFTNMTSTRESCMYTMVKIYRYGMLLDELTLRYAIF